MKFYQKCGNELITKRIVCLMLAVCFALCLSSCAREEMTSDELVAKRIVEQADDGVSDVEYVNLLEESNNGYRDYYYYDVITEDGDKYIVEIKDLGSRKEYVLKKSYSSNSERKDLLQDLIEYRCSELGSLGDSISNNLNALRSYY